jgi:hypothetical protein
MKIRSIALTLALLASITGCAGSTSGTLPGATNAHPASASTHHLSTATHVVRVTRSLERGLRAPKEIIGNIPLVSGLLCVVVDLLDAPLVDAGDAQVNLGLVGINALSNGVATPLVQNATPQVVNLLALQQIAQQYIAGLPPGSYDTLQLVVDPTTSSVVYHGTTFPVQFGNVPSSSGDYAGIDSAVAFSGTAGGTVTVTADFNVFESVDIEGGVAQIDPQVVIAMNAGDVAGNLVNAAGGPVSNAVVLALDQNGNILNTTITDGNGNFTLHALSAGSATLVVQNAYTSASGEDATANGADATPPPPVPITVPGGSSLAVGSLTD